MLCLLSWTYFEGFKVAETLRMIHGSCCLLPLRMGSASSVKIMAYLRLLILCWGTSGIIGGVQYGVVGSSPVHQQSCTDWNFIYRLGAQTLGFQQAKLEMAPGILTTGRNLPFEHLTPCSLSYERTKGTCIAILFNSTLIHSLELIDWALFSSMSFLLTTNSGLLRNQDIRENF